jgi:hypothetical protein
MSNTTTRVSPPATAVYKLAIHLYLRPVLVGTARELC